MLTPKREPRLASFLVESILSFVCFPFIKIILLLSFF